MPKSCDILSLTTDQLELLKLVTLSLMVLDHVAFILDLPSFFFSTGRLVFPTFVFLVVFNVLFRTQNIRRYVCRLFFFAVLSQPVYIFALGKEFYYLNVLFSLSIGAALVWLLENFVMFKNNIYLRFLVPNFALIGLLYLSVISEFSIMGFLLFVFFYCFFKFGGWVLLACVAVTIGLLNSMSDSILLMFSGLLFFPLILALKKVKFKAPKLNKWFFYIFYPAHLLVLKLVLS